MTMLFDDFIIITGQFQGMVGGSMVNPIGPRSLDLANSVLYFCLAWNSTFCLDYLCSPMAPIADFLWLAAWKSS